MKNTATEQQPKTWIERLKAESWEAELLIDTVSIFGALQLFKLVEWLSEILIDRIPPSQYFIGYAIVYAILLGVSVLTSTFILHFILRAYWVGLVGLNSVFPEYGDLEDSFNSKIYTQKMLSILPPLKKTVNDVDELCSIVFSGAFSMLGIYIYMGFVGIIYLLLFNWLSEYVPTYVLLIPLFIFAVVMAFQMLFTIIANLKPFKENYTLQNTYFHIVKWGSLLFMGPFYKYALQIMMTFLSNHKKKKTLTWFGYMVLGVGMLISFLQFETVKLHYFLNSEDYFDNTEVYSGFYHSRMVSPEFLMSPQIDSDIIATKTMRLFVPIYSYESGLRKNACGKRQRDTEKTLNEQRREKRIWRLDCYNKYNHVSLNGNKLDIDFIKYQQPETQQFGIIGYVNLEQAHIGRNTLKVTKTLDSDTLQWHIPFQYSYD